MDGKPKQQRGKGAGEIPGNEPPAAPDPVREWWKAAGVCALLAAMVLIVFGQTLRHGFVNYDDDTYVYQNPLVTAGLSRATVGRAFTHSDLNLWTPLTTISHMVDFQFHGLNPHWHHLTNVLLHMATAVALFLVLWRMTGALWRSAFVAAVFAIHPLHVESVAWISERKDVLSGLFFMLTLGAYLCYTRRRSAARYLPVVLLFALGLMAKQMLVTLPFLLLVLDYWPLKRFAQQGDEGRGGLKDFLPLVIEKIPLFALSIASCAQAFMEKTAGRETVVPVVHSLPLRTGNALVSYAVYIGQMFYPVKLTVFYPFPASVPAWRVAGALAVLAGISAAVFAWRRSRPALLAGWLWYVGMLVPVIGFVRVGKEAHADRYTYLPQIGLYIALAWLFTGAFARPGLRRMAKGGAAAVLCALMVTARHQASYWSDSITLWNRALECTRDNFLARNNLAIALALNGQMDEAIGQYREALQINPGNFEIHSNLGSALRTQGRLDEAMAQYHEALRINPDYMEAHYNLGNILLQQGQAAEAIGQYREALRINPGLAVIHNSLGDVLFRQGQTQEAIAEYREALRIDPSYAEARGNLANAMQQEERTGGARSYFTR